jgi:uncharacterized peroxidase-related enzyme
MAFVRQVSEAEASPELKHVYEHIREKFGFLPNYAQALGGMPQLLEQHFAFGGQITGDGALPAVVKEQVGVVVSGINTSSYCVAVHLELLRRMGIEKPLARKLATNYPSAQVAENVQAIFRFADQLTRRPGEVEKTDVEALRAAGWDEAAIVEAVLTIAYFNFINRVSLGLGLMADL